MNYFQGTQQTAIGQPQGAYSPQMVSGARTDLLAQLGMGLMAAGQPMSGAQRAQYLAQLGQAPAQYQQDLAQRLAAQQQAQLYQQQQAFRDIITKASPEQLDALGIPRAAADIYKSLPGSGPADVAEKALTSKFSASGANMGMQLQYWETTNPDGTTTLHAGQLQPGGGVKEVQLPPNSQWSPTQRYLDTGTAYQQVPTRGPATGGATIPKDVQGTAEQRARGTALADAPFAQARVDQAATGLDMLAEKADEIMRDPAVDRITGPMSMIPNMPGGAAANLQGKLDTLKSKMAFGVLQSMRDASKTGGAVGQVSDFEERMLQQYIANIRTDQGADSFRQQMQEVIDYAQRVKTELAQAYQSEYGGGGQAPNLQPQQPQQPKIRTYNPQTDQLE
jgi:hypothetical protein